ncbi:MAG: baseplate J/gp47 family protein [Clostridia bacterium]|nr:baseplate J/gp47 family protein [Clostridia bacterium]
MRTKEEIMEEMLEVYEFPPAECCKEFERLKIMAELFADMEKKLDEAERNCRVETATGESLDIIAGEYGITRKPAVKSSGRLELSRSTALDYDVTIPEGCIFASDETEFETVENAMLEAGAVSVNVKAGSIGTGEKYNVLRGKINRIISAPSVVEAVRNITDFSGGRDAEGDTSLRKRVKSAIEFMPTGANREFYIQEIMKHERIRSCNVSSEGNGCVNIYVFGMGELSPEELESIRKDIHAKSDFGISINVENANVFPVDLSLYVRVKEGFGFGEVRENVLTEVIGLFDSLSPGDKLSRSDMVMAVMSAVGVEKVNIPGSFEDIDTMPDCILTLGDISIREDN